MSASHLLGLQDPQQIPARAVSYCWEIEFEIWGDWAVRAVLKILAIYSTLRVFFLNISMGKIPGAKWYNIRVSVNCSVRSKKLIYHKSEKIINVLFWVKVGQELKLWSALIANRGTYI
jgi:hypothetical protein